LHTLTKGEKHENIRFSEKGEKRLTISRSVGKKHFFFASSKVFANSSARNE